MTLVTEKDEWFWSKLKSFDLFVELGIDFKLGLCFYVVLQCLSGYLQVGFCLCLSD